MEHPHSLVGVMLPSHGRDPRLVARRWDLVEHLGGPGQDKYAISPDVVRREGLLNAAYKVQAYTGTTRPLLFGHDGSVEQKVVDAHAALRTAVRSRDPRLLSVGQLSTLAAAAPELARFSFRRAAARRPRSTRDQISYRVRVMAEQEPSPSSRLVLADSVDWLGMPEAALDWRLTALDTRSMVQGQTLVAGDLGEALGGTVVTVLGREGDPRPLGGAHHMGTTRMSASPRSGVVDRDCRVHGVHNLFVAGSSMFATSGAANPTLTIVALAARLARRLGQELTA